MNTSEIITLLKIQLYKLFGKKNYKKLVAKSPKKSKTIITSNVTLEFNSQVKKEVEKIGQSAKEILKKYKNEPEKILDYIQEHGTPVIICKKMDKILRLIGEAEGFIMPVSGFKALYLTIAINIFAKRKLEIGLKTPEIFALSGLPTSLVALGHQFHHWYGFKKNLPGYDEETQEMFKNIMFSEKNPNFAKEMSLEEILALKDAVDRDNEAIDFIREFAKEQLGAQEAHNKIKDGKSIDL